MLSCAPGNTIAHGASLGLPHNSPLMKLAMRPKPCPIGSTAQTRSPMVKSRKLRRLQNQMIDRITPSAAPWNDIPPFHTSSMCQDG